MFHSNTQHMIDYWRGKSGLAGAPARAAIDPTEFARLAPQALMLGLFAIMAVKVQRRLGPAAAGARADRPAALGHGAA